MVLVFKYSDTQDETAAVGSMFLQDMDMFALQLTAEEHIYSSNISKDSIHNCTQCIITHHFPYSELEVKTIHAHAGYSMPLVGISTAGNSIVLDDPDLFTENDDGMDKLKRYLDPIILKDEH